MLVSLGSIHRPKPLYGSKAGPSGDFMLPAKRRGPVLPQLRNLAHRDLLAVHSRLIANIRSASAASVSGLFSGNPTAVRQ